jgi:hypothetical protein
MKVLTEPKAGKCGVVVYQQGRYGQIARALAIPANPQTAPQMAVRNRLTLASRGWAALTQAVRDAWTALAATLQSQGTLGLHGALTGNQLFTRVYCNLMIIGADAPTTPPAMPTFAPLPVASLEITNPGGVVALKLVTTGSPPDGTMLRAAAPCSAGRYKPGSYRFLSVLGSPVANRIDITNVFTARYGAPAVGAKVFVRVNQNIEGITDTPMTFVGIVPASS